VGNTLLFSQVSTSGNWRAMPYTMPQSGTIQSITIYHQGGTGRLVLGVYDGNTLPDSRLALTSATPLNSTAGWQTVPLLAPVYVAAGERIWLAWVFEQNPGLRYRSGSPGRSHSSQSWGGGMPKFFGSSSTTNYIYSIYADYVTDPKACHTSTARYVRHSPAHMPTDASQSFHSTRPPFSVSTLRSLKADLLMRTKDLPAAQRDSIQLPSASFRVCLRLIKKSELSFTLLRKQLHTGSTTFWLFFIPLNFK
jgi:hypothetical protein